MLQQLDLVSYWLFLPMIALDSVGQIVENQVINLCFPYARQCVRFERIVECVFFCEMVGADFCQYRSYAPVIDFLAIAKLFQAPEYSLVIVTYFVR